jgi:hypothetical protein
MGYATPLRRALASSACPDPQFTVRIGFIQGIDCRTQFGIGAAMRGTISAL